MSKVTSRREQMKKKNSKIIFSKSLSKEKKLFGDHRDSSSSITRKKENQPNFNKKSLTTENLKFAFSRKRTSKKRKSKWNKKGKENKIFERARKNYKRGFQIENKFTHYRPFKFSRGEANETLRKKCENLMKKIDIKGELNLDMNMILDPNKPGNDEDIDFESPFIREIEFPSKGWPERRLNFDMEIIKEVKEELVYTQNSKSDNFCWDFVKKEISESNKKNLERKQSELGNLELIKIDDFQNFDSSERTHRGTIGGFQFYKINEDEEMSQFSGLKNSGLGRNHFPTLTKTFNEFSSIFQHSGKKSVKKDPSRYSRSIKKNEDFIKKKRSNSLINAKKDNKNIFGTQKENLDVEKRSKSQIRRRKIRDISSFFPRLEPMKNRKIVEKDDDILIGGYGNNNDVLRWEREYSQRYADSEGEITVEEFFNKVRLYGRMD